MKKSKQTIAEYIADFFSQKKISSVFMVTGGGAMFLNDAFSKNKKLNCYCLHHEQSCAIAAEAYFKVKNVPAIVNVTTGPGASNAITGVYGAFVDSAAMIVISGQVKRQTMKGYFSENLRQLGDQELDIVKMVKTITKYAIVLDNPELVEIQLNEAYESAISGRPGPVWIDVPIDMQSLILPKQKKIIKKKKNEDLVIPKIQSINHFVERLAKSERPVIIVGTGVHMSSMSKEVIKFARKLQIPIVSSFCASDVIPTSDPLFIGRQGTIGDRAGNFAVQNADLVLILGARMNIRQVSYDWAKFAPFAFKVMVDIDQEELNKPTLKIDLKIHASLKFFFDFLERTKFKEITPKHEFLNWCQARKDKYPAVLAKYYESKKINPYVFVKECSKIIPEKSVIVTADGAAAITSFQAFETKKGQRLFSNSGSAPMGFDLPAAIGAAIAVKHLNHYEKKVFCFAGDGSIMMNLQELQSIKTMKLNVSIFIINNGGYLSIYQTQSNYFKDNIFGCKKSPELGFPSFKKISNAFGIKYFAINSLKDLPTLQKLKKSQGPVVVEVFVDEKQLFEPKLVSKRLPDGSFVSPELDDMFPFLSANELKINRINRGVSDEGE
jgi:acetolactate synthase-1/2/3 large subunit